MNDTGRGIATLGIGLAIAAVIIWAPLTRDLNMRMGSELLLVVVLLAGPLGCTWAIWRGRMGNA